MSKRGKRNSNLELLRIISMFFIVLHHYAYHGSMEWAQEYNRAYVNSDYVYLILSCLGKAAVVSFVMIGAYFLSRKQFKILRVVHLCITTFVYSWIIYLFLDWRFPQFIHGKSMQEIWWPIPIPSNYWFVIAYVYLLLIMPFMNLIINKLTRRQLAILIWILVIFWCFLEFIPNNKLDNVDYSYFNFNNYFLLIYLIAGYVRKYRPIWTVGIGKTFLIFAIGLVVSFSIIYNTTSKNYNSFAVIMASLSNPLSLVIGVTTFSLFNNINLGHNRIINYISKSMFGVYLIHDNSFIRPIIWHKFINTKLYAVNSSKYLQYGLQVSAIIFCICVGIDIFKRIFIDPIINFLVVKSTNTLIQWSRGSKKIKDNEKV